MFCLLWQILKYPECTIFYYDYDGIFLGASPEQVLKNIRENNNTPHKHQNFTTTKKRKPYNNSKQNQVKATPLSASAKTLTSPSPRGGIRVFWKFLENECVSR